MKRDEKLKRKALHRGIDDILNPEAALTSKLLEKVRPKAKKKDEPLPEIPSPEGVQYPNMRQYPEGTAPYQATVSSQGTVPLARVFPHKEGYLELPNTVADQIAKQLTPFEWAIYFRLFRLSHGWRQDTCTVGVKTLIESTNISENQVRRTLKSLQQKGLIEVLEVINTKEIKGTKYRVYTVPSRVTVPRQMTVPPSGTVPNTAPNKKDDDDLLNTDHHQRETIRIYQEVTKNEWRKSDDDAYQKIKDVPLDKIEQGIRLATQRAASRPNSLNYFVREILSLAKPSEQSKSQRKKALEKIVQRVREIHVGQANYTFPDFLEDVKRACSSEGLPFDNDLFNEILGL